MNGSEQADLAQQASNQQEAPAHADTQLELVVGSDGISAKDQMMLRSLLKIMDGQHGWLLKFSDELSDCNIVLMPAHRTSPLPPIPAWPTSGFFQSA